MELDGPKDVDFPYSQNGGDRDSMIPFIATIVVLVMTICILAVRHYLLVKGGNASTNEINPSPNLSNTQHGTKVAYKPPNEVHDTVTNGDKPTREKNIEKPGKLNRTKSKHEDYDRMSHLELLLKSSSTTVDGPLPQTYNLHCETTMTNKGNRLRKCVIGQECDPSKSVTRKSEKVIMVVGATGAGKTTLINGMVNYVLGVKWEDYCRFKVVVDEDEEQIQNAAVSQTQWITAYTLHHQKYFNVPFTLTIVDTPGFGDTRGIEQDKKTMQQITKFFHDTGADGIAHLTAIGFVVQASNARLTHAQKFIFDSVLSLFGKDVAQNIYLMVTFADGQKPPVMSAVKDAEIPFTSSFKFNNSALFANNTGESRGDDDDIGFDKMFWQMGLKSYKIFFQALKTAENKSLQLTKDVLKERLTLETYVEGIHVQLQLGLNKLHQLKTEVQVLHEHQADIDRNKKFEYTVTEDRAVKKEIPNGQHTTTCLSCNFTCHESCAFADDDDKVRCCAMSNGNCTVCPGKCHWKRHNNMPYKITMESEVVIKTSTDLKDKYEKALGKKLSAEELIDEIKQDFEAVQINVVFLTEQIRGSVEKLDDIALRPNPMSALDYIDLLIEAEKTDHRPGWGERVQQLQGARKKAELIYSVKGGEFKPFQEYEEEQKTLMKRGGGTETSYLRKMAAGLKKRISEGLSG